MKINFSSFKCLFFFLVLCANPFLSIAQEESVLLLGKNENHRMTGFYTYILEDEKQELVLEDILKDEKQKQFKLHEKKYINFGFSTSAYWLKINVKNTSLQVNDWAFVMSYPQFDYFEFYENQNGKWISFITGDNFPFVQRKIMHRNYIMPINLGDTVMHSYYVRMKSNGSFQFPLELLRSNYFLELDGFEQTAFGLFYGVMFVMMIYNLFLFFSFRYFNYIYYVLSILFSTLFVAATNGHAYQIFWANYPILNNTITATFIGGWILFTCIFTKKFLGLQHQNHQAAWVMNFGMGLGVFTMISHFIFGYGFSVKYGAASVGLTAVLILLVSTWSFFKGEKAARFFLLAWVIFLFGVIMIVLARFGILPFNFFTTHGIEVGSVFEVLLLSFALGDKFKLILEENRKIQEMAFRTQKEANDSLEIKVVERTQSMQEAMEELNQTNEELESTLELVQTQNREIDKKNQDLTSGITYSRRIQQAFLPSVDEIQKYIPDFFMLFLPRDIVSGDFYWFKQKEDTVFLAIVDCTGHGVPGALMSMIGANLLTEIVSIFNIEEPSKILLALNEGIINALHQDENDNRDGMVISFLKFDFNNKKLSFAGARHGLLVVKSQTDYDYVRGDKFSLGDTFEQKRKEIEFTTHHFDLDGKTTFYTFTDGYADQFGGINNKKFRLENLNQFLVKNVNKPFAEQKLLLEKNLKDWQMQSRQSQIDDILVCGFRI